MRVELVNGRWLLCGHILSPAQIKRGQEWAPASGGDYTVTVSGVRDGWVCYSWLEPGKTVRYYHEKEAFAFQCRYCLVLPDSNLPTELL